MSDIDRFWRVYRPEWSVHHVSDTDGEDGRQECVQRFINQYKGRILPEDSRMVPWSLTAPEWWPWMLELRLPVMKGEYKGRPLALEHAHRIDGVVVFEGGRGEERLLSYGRRMLRKGFVDSQGLEDAGAARGTESEAGRAGA
jgi:hypothetical protein